jgi:hypothetical protein
LIPGALPQAFALRPLGAVRIDETMRLYFGG